MSSESRAREAKAQAMIDEMPLAKRREAMNTETSETPEIGGTDVAPAPDGTLSSAESASL